MAIGWKLTVNILKYHPKITNKKYKYSCCNDPKLDWIHIVNSLTVSVRATHVS
jgi:hypothetical protein